MERGTAWGQIKKTERSHKASWRTLPDKPPQGLMQEGKQALNHCLGKQNAFHSYVYLHTCMKNVWPLLCWKVPLIWKVALEFSLPTIVLTPKIKWHISVRYWESIKIHKIKLQSPINDWLLICPDHLNKAETKFKKSYAK